MNLPEIPKSKPLGIITLGIVLYVASAYMNILQTGSADIGWYLGIGLILLGTTAQIINWINFWNEKKKLRE